MSAKLAQYELGAALGVGGMGEVFRARDTRLDRAVAIKVLPESMAADPERVARFDREAKTLASLTHANIATIHDFMSVDGKSFLVMELVEGEDLSQRLERGAVPPDEARQIAIQLATGLEAAHERNIVHRDLKPANVKITPDGQVKILDFGLARAMTGDVEDGSDPMLSPTITQAMTQAGTILGTAAYMSPEQARGKTVDKRADIWAFGVLLYEMLTGERLFEGETTSDTLASVLKHPVDFDDLPDEVPADMVWVLQRCLDRNPTRRLRDIGEARLVLSGESTVSQVGMRAVTEDVGRPGSRLWPILAAVLGAALVASFFLRPDPTEVPQVRGAIPLPPDLTLVLGTRQPGPPAIAPDGSAVVFSGLDNQGMVRLWYRRLDQPAVRVLEGTRGGSYPFWSPDSRSIGFFGENDLWRLDLPSGSPMRLADGAFGKGGSWSEDGTIVFSPSYNTAIHAVSARGGDLPRAVTVLDSAAGDNSHRHPFFLPDREHFLYLARGAADSTRAVGNTIRVGSLSGEVRVDLAGADGHAEFHAGHLLFARGGALIAQPFDAKSFTLRGDPRVILPEIESIGAAARTAMTISRDNFLVYEAPFLDAGADVVTSYDRNGNETERYGEAATISHVVVSPDRRRAAVVHGEGGATMNSIWMLDMERGTRSRFPAGGIGSAAPVWSPDGRFLAYAQINTDGLRILVRRVDGGGEPVEIARARANVAPESWSPSGRWLSYTDGFRAILLQEMDDAGQPVGEPVALVEAKDGTAWGSCFLGSDDWIAYHAATESSFQLFVAHTRDPSRRFQITSEGALFASYNPVTEELGFTALGSDLFTAMKVEIPTPGADPVFGVPRQLFRLPARELDNPVDFHGDAITIGSKLTQPGTVQPLFVLDWTRLLED